MRGWGVVNNHRQTPHPSKRIAPPNPNQKKCPRGKLKENAGLQNRKEGRAVRKGDRERKKAGPTRHSPHAMLSMLLYSMGACATVWVPSTIHRRSAICALCVRPTRYPTLVLTHAPRVPQAICPHRPQSTPQSMPPHHHTPLTDRAAVHASGTVPGRERERVAPARTGPTRGGSFAGRARGNVRKARRKGSFKDDRQARGGSRGTK